MATDPAFAATPNTRGVIVPATLDASLTAPTNVATAFTAGANGSKIEQIRVMQVATTATISIVNIFLHDGAAYHLWEEATFAIATLSATVEIAPVDFYYPVLVLPTGWTVRVSVTNAAGQSAFKVVVMGADY